MQTNWQSTGSNFIWQHSENLGWRIVLLEDGRYVVDHRSIPYPRRDHTTLAEAMGVGDEKYKQWKENSHVESSVPR